VDGLDTLDFQVVVEREGLQDIQGIAVNRVTARTQDFRVLGEVGTQGLADVQVFQGLVGIQGIVGNLDLAGFVELKE